MDRRLSFVSPRLVAPLVIVWLGAMAWLFLAGQSDRKDTASRPVQPDLAESPTAAAATADEPALMWRPHSANWLPPITDQTRTVLTAFLPPVQTSRPARMSDGPLLLPARPDSPRNEPGAAQVRSLPPTAAPPVVKSRALVLEDTPRIPSEPTANDEEPFLAELEAAFPLTEPDGIAFSQPQSEASPVPEASPRPASVASSDEPPLDASADSDSQVELEKSSEPPALLALSLEATAERSPYLESIAREADMHTRRGFELAGRRAYYSARAEFIRALRLSAQALDTEYRTARHSRALAAGLTALKEVTDFMPDGSRLEADLDMAGIIAGHQTPVFQGIDTKGLTPFSAVQSYFTFAQEQLGTCAGQEVAGSMALHALGKLHATLAVRKIKSIRAAEPTAVVFYQASLLVSPHNYMASNDLGVLLTRAGRYEDARIAFEHSVSVCQQTASWHNLAVVYRRLGQPHLALNAERQSEAVCQTRVAPHAERAGAVRRQVDWLDPQSFAQSFAASPGLQPPMPVRSPSAPRSPEQTNVPLPKPRVATWPFRIPSDERK